jgi:nicotinamidase/pyrazinamidase
VSSADCHAPGDDEFSQFPPHCLRGTPGQRRVVETGREVVVPSAPADTIPDPRRVHVLLEKQQFSLFSNPEAEPILAATGARRMVVFGVVTEVCVRQAAEGLLARGYAVDLVEDAVWPLDPAGGAKVLLELEARGARRTTTASVLARTATQVASA